MSSDTENPTSKDDALNIVEFFSRHLISIGCTHFNTRDGSDPKLFRITGFLVSIDDHWFIATAGHVIEAIDRAIKSYPERTFLFRMNDSFGEGAEHQIPIPFDYRSAPKFSINDEEIGADFGLIYISPFYKLMMGANPQVPVSEEQWQMEPDIHEKLHIIVGIPQAEEQQLPSETVRRDSVFQQPFEVYSLLVKKIDEPPAGIRQYGFPSFWAELGNTGELTTLKGMSGSPILALGTNASGEIKYWVVGVQSGEFQNRTPAIVHGCCVRTLMQRSEAFFRENVFGDEVAAEETELDG